MTTSPHAVVLGSFETALGVVRSLGRAGIPTLVLDHQGLHAAHSRYASACSCPHPAADPDGFITALKELARPFDSPPVLYVTADEYLEPVARHRDELAKLYRFNIPDTALLTRIADKCAQVALATEVGVAVPMTQLVTNRQECERAIERIPLPAFVKARDVVAWRRIFGSSTKGIAVRTKDEMRSALRQVLERDVHVIVQEVIPGDATQHQKVSAYISTSGEVLAAFTLRKLRQNPHGFGFGCVVETIEQPELLALGTDFLLRIGYRGTGSAEFKFDVRDGRFKLIELNPRYWQQNALAERVGMNFPVLEYRDLCGLTVEPVTRFRTGVKWVSLGADLETSRQLWRSGELTVGDWLRSLQGEICWSDISMDDPGPGLWVMRQAVALRWQHLKRLFGLRDAN